MRRTGFILGVMGNRWRAVQEVTLSDEEETWSPLLRGTSPCFVL